MAVPEKYKGVTFPDSTFPDAPYKTVKVVLNPTIVNEYIPALQRALPAGPKGLHLLLTAMTHQEGFKPGTRAYRTNNPGNIGNTDSGANKQLARLEDGILLQAQYINDIIAGKKSAYPMGKEVTIKPYFSEEIAKNPQYGLPAHLPGYKFTFTGQLDQYVKIYSTGARATNSYINTIVSYFKDNGLTITPASKLQDIIKMT